ncbi:MAG TPA: hypothetical protein VD811_15705 [Desulfuromonadales bacterium]|nr:hypothetical protein [Desulfuromonadales bacterium]
MSVINHRRVNTPPAFVGLRPPFRLDSSDPTGADNLMLVVDVLDREIAEDPETVEPQVIPTATIKSGF